MSSDMDRSDMDRSGIDGTGPSEDGMENRLPPPAFPPGSRRIETSLGPVKVETGRVEGALISPDEPLPERAPTTDEAFFGSGAPVHEIAELADDDAFISPDEPMPKRKAGRGVDLSSVDPGEVVVTGMGHDAHLEPQELALGGDPHVIEISEVVSKLAADIRQKGEAGLRSTLDMGRFEATLRAYCVGYLAGRRTEVELPPPDFRGI